MQITVVLVPGLLDVFRPFSCPVRVYGQYRSGGIRERPASLSLDSPGRPFGNLASPDPLKAKAARKSFVSRLDHQNGAW